MGLNTKIEYLYRDAGNWKQYNECVINGVLTPAQIETILNCCNDEYFIPSKVGLPEKRFEKWTEDDHIWFEFNDWYECFSETNEPATVDITPEALVEAFLSRKGKWEDNIGLSLTDAIERSFFGDPGDYVPEVHAGDEVIEKEQQSVDSILADAKGRVFEGNSGDTGKDDIIKD